MAISSAPIQQVANQEIGLTTTVTIAAPQVGNALIACIGANPATADVTGITGGGVTWVKAVGTSTNRDSEIWYGLNSDGTGGDVVVTWDEATTGSGGIVNVSEWSGLPLSGNPVATIDTNTSSGATAQIAGPIVNKNAGSLIIATIRNGNSLDHSAGPTNGFTALTDGVTGAFNAAYLIPGTNASWSTTWTYGSAAYEGQMVEFLPAGSITKIASVGAGAGAGGDNVTTASIDTTGADFLVAVVSSSLINPDAVLTDSKGNTWTPRTIYDPPGSPRVQLYYVANPTVGTLHTFTITSTDDSPTVLVAAFSGVDTSSPYDTENGASATDDDLATGSITPSQDGELLIVGVSSEVAENKTIDLGFTITDQIQIASGQHFGGAMAYQIQTTATAKNPTWSGASAGDMAATIASFKAASASPTLTIQAKARVKQGGVAKTVTAKGRVKQLGVAKTIQAKARVRQVGAKTITAKADIKKLGVARTIQARAAVRKTQATTITSKGRLRVVNVKTIQAKGQILGSGMKTVSAKARIVDVGKVTLVAPPDGSSGSSPVEFEWTIPGNRWNEDINFEIMVDQTDVTFADLEENLVSWQDLQFEYWDGDSWEPITVNGVPSAFIGSRARTTLSLTTGTKHWRVRAFAG